MFQTSFSAKGEEGDDNSKLELLALLDVALGGRVAEELQFGKDYVSAFPRVSYYNNSLVQIAMTEDGEGGLTIVIAY